MRSVFEVDEAYLSELAKNRDSKKLSAKVVESNGRKELQGFIRNYVDGNTTVYTDDHNTYEKMEYKHESVKYCMGEYLRIQMYVNAVESFWALLRVDCHGSHYHMSSKHRRYVLEFSGLNSVRKMGTIDAMKFIAHW